MSSTIITVELSETNGHFRWPCCVCGADTEKTDIVAVAFPVSGVVYEAIVCQVCLDGGPGGVRETLRRRGDPRSARGASLAEAEWRMPTLQQFREAEQVSKDADAEEDSRAACLANRGVNEAALPQGRRGPSTGRRA